MDPGDGAVTGTGGYGLGEKTVEGAGHRERKRKRMGGRGENPEGGLILPPPSSAPPDTDVWASLSHMGLIQVERSLALLWLKSIASDNEIFVIGNSEREKKKPLEL